MAAAAVKVGLWSPKVELISTLLALAVFFLPRTPKMDRPC